MDDFGPVGCDIQARPRYTKRSNATCVGRAESDTSSCPYISDDGAASGFASDEGAALEYARAMRRRARGFGCECSTFSYFSSLSYHAQSIELTRVVLHRGLTADALPQSCATTLSARRTRVFRTILP